MGKWKELAQPDDIHTCHADCQNPACVAVRQAAEIHTCTPKQEEGCAECGKQSSEGWALYCVKCSEPVREWQGLTDEDMDEAMKYWSDPCRSAYGGAEAADDEYVDMIGTWRYIEAKLKEKNT